MENLNFTPYLVLSSSWSKPGYKDLELTLPQLHILSDAKRKAVKRVCDYTWDDTHFYVQDIYGKLVLTIQFYENEISVWEYRTGYSIGSFKSIKEYNEFFTRDAMTNLALGYAHYCSSCKKWCKDGKSFSFAGWVCDNCYNPKIHLPPDTRGD